MAYRFLDFGVVSELPLPLTDEDWQPEKWISIRLSPLASREQIERHDWEGSFRPAIYCEKYGEASSVGFDLVFVDYLRARISQQNLEILVDVHSDDERAVGHLIVDQVLPRMLGQKGGLVLHGGAVSDEQGALVFLGETGSGKSTLCASFYQEGWCLLSDDCVSLNPVEKSVIGGYPGLRLYEDSVRSTLGEMGHTELMAGYSEKQRLPARCQSHEPQSLRALILLEPEANNFYLEPLCGSAAALAILSESFSLWPGDTRLASTKLQAVSEMLQQGLPVFRCGLPHDYDQLPALKSRIVAGL